MAHTQSLSPLTFWSKQLARYGCKQLARYDCNHACYYMLLISPDNHNYLHVTNPNNIIIFGYNPAMIQQQITLVSVTITTDHLHTKSVETITLINT